MSNLLHSKKHKLLFRRGAEQVLLGLVLKISLYCFLLHNMFSVNAVKEKVKSDYCELRVNKIKVCHQKLGSPKSKQKRGL